MKNSIPFLLASSLVVLMTTTSFAEDKAADNSGKAFENIKTEMLKGVDERIDSLQKAKTCISSAKDRDALKGCHAEVRKERMEHREHMMEKRMKHMEDRKERMEERKEKMGKSSN